MEHDLHLDIDSHVVRQLGEELITDSEQALLELVKNSYDADANWCSVEIDTGYIEHVKVENTNNTKNNKKPLNGRITVSDNGFGMTLEDIKRGWLTISLSLKKSMKERGETTPIYHRTPIGDKGLGRLGTMKLGNRIKITTFCDPQIDGYEVSFFWNDCQSGLPLSNVPVALNKIPATGNTGTFIEICDLNTPSYWIGEKRLKELRMSLSTLISPFQSFDNFDTSLVVNKRSFDLVHFTKKFLNTSDTHFELTWDGSTLELIGRAKLGLFKTGKVDGFFQQHLLHDKGDNFFDFLNKENFASKINLRKSKSRIWFIEFSESIQWEDIIGTVRKDLPLKDPGVFVGELFGFDLDISKTEVPDIATGMGNYKQIVKKLSGVYIFRNNFRIRMGRDWFDLGTAWTSGRSWYGLKPNNTIGYFSISAKDNLNMIEKSDREGFVDNSEWYAFESLTGYLRKFANDSLNYLRRAYPNFRKIELNKENNLPENFSAEQGAEELTKLVQSAKEIHGIIKNESKQSIASYENMQQEIKYVLADNKTAPKMKAQFLKLQNSIDNISDQFKFNIQKIENILEQITEKERAAELIVERFALFNEQMSEVYETVGIGLSAQGLVHEVHPFIDEITARIQKIRNTLKNFSYIDTAIIGDLENIRLQAGVIGRKMAYIDPMLRTFREITSKISLSLFLLDYFELRKDRLERFGIKYFIPFSSKEDIILNFNKGRLTQVVDNLTRNSEYWLRKLGEKNRNATLEIHVEFSPPHLIFWDSGSGVRPPMEDVLFDIFTSDKPKNEGHGLGLFIVTQLLESEGCSIYLDEERNSSGRRYKFVINFSGAIDG